MTFEQAYEHFIQSHLQKRTGERRGRLERGHREAEKQFCSHVWWPLVGGFDDLHPEYEVLDWRGRPYFCDFAWLTPYVKLVIEVKGYGPHVRDMDRLKYCNELNREAFLSAMGFQVISFSYDDVSQRPELCVTLLRMVLSRFMTNTSKSVSPATAAHKELIRLANALGRPLRPIDVERYLNINHRTAVNLLRTCSKYGWFAMIAGAKGKNIVRYELLPSGIRQL
ncbi:DUF559 domain-containing protein [Paenibacillus kobensis]|uniref:DUF559 domain-containing protein n=1 Tax=Paenibacillus kobensis TaxID=59841 RepID=UPI000FD728F2|nr:DUF559 domain-containing protein [Paenibacillus kobensis]